MQSMNVTFSYYNAFILAKMVKIKVFYIAQSIITAAVYGSHVHGHSNHADHKHACHFGGLAGGGAGEL